MEYVTKLLALLAPFDIFNTIALDTRPIISYYKDLVAMLPPLEWRLDIPWCNSSIMY